MLLRNITLEDFGAYRGVQSLNLTTRPGKPIILIGGLNGCGKTTLLDAIQLVLYGPLARCSGRGNSSYDSYLRESINRQADPANGATITLEFTIPVEGEDHRYKVVRKWDIKGKTLHEYVIVLVNEKYDRVKSEGWAAHVEELLPLEIGSLFFFDGEKIESLADPDRAAAVIESAVHSLLGVSTVEQLRNDLQTLQRRQKLTDEDQEAIVRIRELEDRHRQVQTEVEAAHARLAELSSRIDVAQHQLQQAEYAFEKDGGGLFERRKDLEGQQKEVAKQLAATEESLRNLAAGALPLLLLSDQLAEVGKQAAIEKAANEAAQVLGILSSRDQELLELLGGLLPVGDLDTVVQRLSADRTAREEASTAERILSLGPDGMAQLSGLEQILAHEQQRARELLDVAAKQADHLDTLDQQLDGVPDEKIIETRMRDRAQAMHMVARLEAERESAAENHEAGKSRRDAVTAELERAHQTRLTSLVKAEEIARIIAYCDRQRNVMEKFSGALLEQNINRLQVAVLDSFRRLMRKNGLVKDLLIDTDKFRLTLVGGDGEPLDPGRLSAGERQLLAVSLLWGLARVAGNRLPSVIDTPLGRLDSRHREHLVDRYFPNASHQVLLLSTDEEIDEYLLGRLKPSIAHTYTLVHDDTTFTTSVEPGYWWPSGAAHVA